MFLLDGKRTQPHYEWVSNLKSSFHECNKSTFSLKGGAKVFLVDEKKKKREEAKFLSPAAFSVRIL